MKKRVQVIMIAAAVAALMLMAAGCGSDTLSDSVKDATNAADTGSSGSVDTANTDQTPALTVENDAFTFEELTLKVGAAEADVLSLIGAADKSDVYTATLFGENTEIVLVSEGDTVSSIQLTFADTNADSLANAISEQLGRDGESADGVTKWTYGSNAITLSTGGKGCAVEITKS